MSGLSVQNYQIDIKKFKRGKRINKEGFVYSVQEKKTGELYAAKVIDCGDEEEQCQKIVTEEIIPIFSVNHPTIIKYFGYSLTDFHDEYNVTVIMQLAKKGSLNSVLKMIQTSNPPKHYTNTSRQIILIGVARAMQYLHDHNIIHGNLKSENVLLDEKYKPLLTNFSLSKSSTNHSKSQAQYVAPEIIKGAPCDKKSDVYSFAILMFEIVTNSIPYEIDDMTDFEFKSKVTNDGFRPTFKCEVKPSIRNLIEKCWSKNSSKRSTFKELFQKLSNKNDDCFLDDVDEEEVRRYVDEIAKNGQNEMDEVMKINESLEKENDQLKTENQKLKAENKNFAKEINKLKNDNSLLKKKISELTKEIENLKYTKTKTYQKVPVKPSKNEHLNKLPPLNPNASNKQQPKSDQAAANNNLKELEKITIKDFNDSTLQSQYETLSKIASFKKISRSNPILINLNNLIQYMYQVISVKECKCVEILSRNEEKYLFDVNEKSVIQIHVTEVEDLFKSKSYKENKFANALKPFNNLSFELVYPSKSFTNIYSVDTLLKGKLSNKNAEFTIRILEINGFHDIAINRKRDYNIVFGNSVNEIEARAFNLFSSITQIEIPSSVTKIGELAFYGCESLTQIIIPSSVTEIGQGAFYGCESLTQIIIPSSVTEIGQCAFAKCTSLAHVENCSSVAEIENNVFENCTSLTQITIPSSVTIIYSYAFCECTSLTQIIIPSSVTEICKYAFLQCTSLSQIKLSSSLTEISMYTFKNCSALEQIEIPSSVTEIGYRAFKRCTSLKDISIPSSVIKIDGGAFKNCEKLTQITIPSSVTEIGHYVFAGCTSLKQISIPSSLKFSGDIFRNCTNIKEILFTPNDEKNLYKFHEKQFLLSKSSADNNNYDVLVWVNTNTNATKIVIPPYIKKIGEGAFENYSSLKQIEIPSSVTSIGNTAFRQCSSLTKIEIPSSVTSIGSHAFSRCSSLTKIEIPSSVTEIGPGAFINCSSLTQIKISSSVQKIECFLFEGCKSLTEIEIPPSVTVIKNNAFCECSLLTKTNIPPSVTIIEFSAYRGCSLLAQINIPPSVTKIENSAFVGCSSLTQIEIPSSVVKIGQEAFKECSSLTQITLPSSLNDFDGSIFVECNNLSNIIINQTEEMRLNLFEDKYLLLKSNSSKDYDVLVWAKRDIDKITVPLSVKQIGDFAFYKCSSLTQINLPSSLTEIGKQAFEYCTSLKQIKLPSSLTKIGSYAFSKCSNLAQIEIPSSVTEMGSNVFYKCSLLNKYPVFLADILDTF